MLWIGKANKDLRKTYNLRKNEEKPMKKSPIFSASCDALPSEQSVLPFEFPISNSAVLRELLHWSNTLVSETYS